MWFSGIFVIVFYLANIIYLNYSLTKIFQSLDTKSKELTKTEYDLNEQQQKWINNPAKCSACGEDITEYDTFCPECGIKLSGKRKKPIWNLTKYDNYRFKYFFKEKK